MPNPRHQTPPLLSGRDDDDDDDDDVDEDQDEDYNEDDEDDYDADDDMFCSGSSQKLTSRDLTQFAHHVARGMEYLSSKKVNYDDDDQNYDDDDDGHDVTRGLELRLDPICL